MEKVYKVNKHQFSVNADYQNMFGIGNIKAIIDKVISFAAYDMYFIYLKFSKGRSQPLWLRIKEIGLLPSSGIYEYIYMSIESMCVLNIELLWQIWQTYLLKLNMLEHI